MSDWKEFASPCEMWLLTGSQVTPWEWVDPLWSDWDLAWSQDASQGLEEWITIWLKTVLLQVQVQVIASPPPPPKKEKQKVTRRMAPRIGVCASFGEGEGAWKLHRNLFKSQFSLILPSQDAHLTHTPHLHPTLTYMPTHCSSNIPYFCPSKSFFILLVLTWHSPRIWHWFQLFWNLLQDYSNWMIRLSTGSPKPCIYYTAIVSRAPLDFNFAILVPTLWLESSRHPVKLIWADLNKGWELQKAADKGHWSVRLGSKELCRMLLPSSWLV